MSKPLSPGDRELTLAVASLARRCLVHIPPTGDKSRPAVIMLHGAGGTATWTRDETGWNATADREGFVVAYPEAIAREPSRPPDFLMNPQMWNVRERGGHDDVEFLAALLDELARRTQIDLQRVYVTGFSNGAAMTFRLAAEAPDRIAAIAPVSGYVPATMPPPARPVPTQYIVGDADPLVPLAGGEVKSLWDGRTSSRLPVAAMLAGWAERLGLPGEPAVRNEPGGVTVAEYGAKLVWLTVAGLGHQWPGGRGRLKRELFGSPSDRLHANERIWNFFRPHTLG